MSDTTINLVQSVSGIVTIHGYMFSYTTGLYLSASPTSALPSVSSYNFFSSIRGLSSRFTAFSGYEITDYTRDANTIQFSLPVINVSCTLIPIIVNSGGYNKSDLVEIVIS